MHVNGGSVSQPFWQGVKSRRASDIRRWRRALSPRRACATHNKPIATSVTFLSPLRAQYLPVNCCCSIHSSQLDGLGAHSVAKMVNKVLFWTGFGRHSPMPENPEKHICTDTSKASLAASGRWASRCDPSTPCGGPTASTAAWAPPSATGCRAWKRGRCDIYARQGTGY